MVTQTVLIHRTSDSCSAAYSRGGFFSFLPILGVWMLPLGLMLIAQDLPFLQKPLVKAFKWVEGAAKWLWLKVKLENRSLTLPRDDSGSLKEPR